MCQYILFFKFKVIYFNWRLITLQYCIGFAIHQHESTTGVHVPHLEPPSHLPPHTIPLGHPSAPAPSILYPASNLDWRFVSYMILYMFQCHSFTNQWSWSICVWSRRQNSPHVPAERDAEGPSGWWTTHSRERRLERPQDHGREAAPQSLWKT